MYVFVCVYVHVFRFYLLYVAYRRHVDNTYVRIDNFKFKCYNIFLFLDDLEIVNIFFAKGPEHLITYKSGLLCTQKDCILTDHHLVESFQGLSSYYWGATYVTTPISTSEVDILVAEFTMPKTIKVMKERVASIRWHKREREQSL